MCCYNDAYILPMIGQNLYQKHLPNVQSDVYVSLYEYMTLSLTFTII